MADTRIRENRTLSLRSSQFIDQWRNEIADRISNHIFSLLFLSLYMHPHSRFDKQRKKKKTSRTSICNPNFLHDFMKLFLTTKERKKERTAFFQKCIRRWRSFLRYFTPLKRFRFVALVVLRSVLSFREGWFQRGKRKERNKRKYTCNAVLRAEKNCTSDLARRR